MARRILLLVALVFGLTAEAKAQSEALYTVAMGVSLEYAPAREHALGVRLYGTTPVIIQPRCSSTAQSCHGPRPSLAPELGIGWRSDTGLSVDMALGAGLATARVYNRGFASRVQLMPQVGLRVNSAAPLERWIGGYVSKSLAGGWSSNHPTTSAEDSGWGLTSARIGVQVPFAKGEWGPTSVQLGAQLITRSVISYALNTAEVEK